eukprot:TRINITY_DN17787_c0_g1_i1.p1 TRINITY_DN17787_c0_g1~~TRINITY_DN17787_c0_g1_i1.p1  ORF type:complete len:226 (+),score=62.64 TRINITY_DN17787_c0_g1_i1:79-756(+)
MKTAFLLIVVACIALSSAQTPPQINKQFTTNYTFVATNFVSNTTTSLFKGFFALDYLNGGAVFTLGGEEFVPIYISTNLVANPNVQAETITGYIYEGDLCWDVGQISKDWLVLFPLSIPFSATFQGNQTIDGQLVGGWKWPVSGEGYNAYVEAWVNYKVGSLVQIVFSELPFVGEVKWNFFNTVVGPMNPDVYAAPKIKCTPFTPMASKESFVIKTLKAISVFMA